MKKKMSLLIIALILAVGISGCQSNLDEAYQRATEERKKSVPEVTDVITSEETEVSASEETEVSASEKTEVIASEETEVIASEETEVIASEKNEVIASEKNEVIASEKNEVIASEEAIIPEGGLELRPFGFIGAEKFRIKVTPKECWLWEGSVARLVATGDFETAKVVRDEKDPDYEGVLVNFDTEIEIYEHNGIIFKSVINGSYVDIRNQHMKIFDEEGTYWEGAGIKKTKLHREDLVEVWTNRPETVRDYSGLRWVKLYEAEGIEKGAGIRTKEVG